MDAMENNKKKRNKSANIKEDDIGFTVDYDKKEFEKSLPHLAKEIFSDDVKTNSTQENVLIDGIYHENEEKFEQIVVDTEQNYEKIKELYEPGIISFIRRCEKDEEVIEIIDYMLNKGEITQKEAEEYKEQLLQYGVRFFGPKKTPGYYQRKFLKTTAFSEINQDKEN
jgi:hypothetical protein